MASIPLQPSSPPVVAALRGAVKRYGSVKALQGIDLAVHRGEVLALLGPNGAGKSTSIALLLGLQRPDAGEVQLFGEAPQSRAARQRIGVMLQSAALHETLTVAELLKQTASYYPVPRAFDELVALAGIGEWLPRRYGKLSGGQQRRVQFALALCGRPELIFLDEPTTGLDLEARETLWATVRSLAQQGCSVLLTTHYLEEAEALADRIAVIGRGRLLAEGSLEAIRSRVVLKHLRGRSALAAEVARAWPGVQLAEREGEFLSLSVQDEMDTLRRWLAADPALRDLEVQRAGLAEAFTEITRAEAPAKDAT